MFSPGLEVWHLVVIAMIVAALLWLWIRSPFGTTARIAWTLIVLLLPGLGALALFVAYLVVGRGKQAASRERRVERSP